MGPMTVDWTLRKVLLEANPFAIYRIDWEGMLWAAVKISLTLCSLRAELKADSLSR